MAVIGCLGDIVFQVSSDTVRTFSNMKRTGSVKFAIHQRYGAMPLTEFTGIDPEKISFDMVLSVFLGADPDAEIEKIIDYERSAKTLPLVIGSKFIGSYRWTITSHDIKPKTYGKNGKVLSTTVSIQLLEYPKA
ncbi:MAG: phage tail protein [Clostridia bacterium]|nr:phage tail protein [Clostridia bacterium]